MQEPMRRVWLRTVQLGSDFSQPALHCEGECGADHDESNRLKGDGRQKLLGEKPETESHTDDHEEVNEVSEDTHVCMEKELETAECGRDRVARNSEKEGEGDQSENRQKGNETDHREWVSAV
jgi:hypothetical protein